MPGRGKTLTCATKKHPKRCFLHIIYKLALLLQLFLSEEIGEQRGA